MKQHENSPDFSNLDELFMLADEAECLGPNYIQALRLQYNWETGARWENSPALCVGVRIRDMVTPTNAAI